MFAGFLIVKAQLTGSVFIGHLARFGNNDSLRMLRTDLILSWRINFRLLGSFFMFRFSDQRFVKSTGSEKRVVRRFHRVILNGISNGLLGANRTLGHRHDWCYKNK